MSVFTRPLVTDVPVGSANLWAPVPTIVCLRLETSAQFCEYLLYICVVALPPTCSSLKTLTFIILSLELTSRFNWPASWGPVSFTSTSFHASPLSRLRLQSSVTSSIFHSRLKTHLFHHFLSTTSDCLTYPPDYFWIYRILDIQKTNKSYFRLIHALTSRYTLSSDYYS